MKKANLPKGEELVPRAQRERFTRKKHWFAPIIIVILLLGALLVLAQGSGIAPFFYTLFQ